MDGKRDNPKEFVAEMPREWWRDWRVLLAVASAIVLAGAILAFGAMRAGEDPGRRSVREDRGRGERPSDDDRTDGTTSSASSDGSTGSAGGGSKPGGDGSSPSGGGAGGSPGADATAPARPEVPAASAGPKVAYRKDGKVWVASEEGTGAVEVLDVGQSGGFALSPDSSVLAGVSGGQLVVVDLIADRRVTVGPAVSGGQIAWAPGSQWLAYVAPEGASTDVMRASRDGSGRSTLVEDASRPAVAPDGKRIAWLKHAEESVLFIGDVASPAGAEQVTKDGVDYLAWAPDGALFYSAGPVLYKRYPGGTTSTFGIPPTAPAALIGDLRPSPDSSRLLYAEIGDDGYSRTYVAAADGSERLCVPCRRDAYPYGWTEDGSRVVYFEGNTFQGQTSRMESARADGTGRVTLAEGVTR